MIRCQNYTNHMNIKFNLIMREKTSPTLFNLFYDPQLKKWKNSLKYQMRSIPLEISKEFLFSRIFSTNKKLTNGRINNLLKELKEEIKEEKEFYADETRINCLNQCVDILNNMLKENDQKKDYILESVFQKQNTNNNNNNISSENKFDLTSNTSSINNTNKANNIINDNMNNNTSDNTLTEDGEINYKKYFLFYQEEEGDIYYLHPFIMDILLTEYGDYSNLPVVISGNILDFEMKQVTPYIKSTYPYLSHLNLGSIIFFVEIDVSKLISGSTRKKFNHALNERAKRRRLLSNEEKNYEKFINKKSIKEEEELKNYYLYHNQLRILNDIEDKKEQKEQKEKKEDEEANNNNTSGNNNENDNDINDDGNNLDNKSDENKKEEESDKDKEMPKKENMLKKLLEENEKEKEEKEREEKERLERLEREKREKEKKESKTFIFDEKDFPELNKKEEKIEKDNNVNKGGKKGKKKGKKKFQEIGEDFLKDAFNTNPNAEEQEKENDKKTKGKKSSKNN